MKLELCTGRPSTSRLVADYLAGDPALRPFFGGHPDREETYLQVAQAVSARFTRAARERALEAVQAPTPEVRARLHHMVERGGFFVTTGQQPGLFTGPLFSVYKALTAVRLAQVLERLLKRPVVPLFWIASEDHDWKEVDHTYTVGLTNRLCRIALGGEGERGAQPIHRIPMGAAAPKAVEEFLALFPNNDFKGAYAHTLRRAYRPEKSMGEAFAGAFGELLGRFGMAFVDASSLPLKLAARPVLVSALDEAQEHEALLTRTAGRLRRAGYPVQVPVLPKGVNLFLESALGRERIYRNGNGFRLRHSGEELPRSRILSRVDGDARVLSPNVLLRPVVESAVFPVLSYVAGPGEIAYFAQLGGLFEAYGMRMPVVHPRFSVAVIEPKIRKVLDKLGLSLEDLARPFTELAGEVVREDVPESVRSALQELRGEIAGGTDRLSRAVAVVDPTLRGPASRIRTVAFAALAQMEKKLMQSLKREKNTILGQLAKAQLHLHPQGGPQERSLNVFYYLVRYGDAFLQALYDRFEVRLHKAGDAAAAAQ